MPKLECHACLRLVEPSEAKWVRPFGSPPSKTDAAGNILETDSDVYSEPVPGAEPYCPECLEKLRLRGSGP